MIEVSQPAEAAPVVRLRVGRNTKVLPTYFTAAYFVDGLLIDTGCAHTARPLVSSLRDWHVTGIVNTHSHEDHIGANAAVQAVFGCPIRAHDLALPVLSDPRLQHLQPYRRLLWGWPEPSRAEALGEWVQTEHYRLQVIPTPGHSPDHVCLFEPQEGWLFTGDAYIGGEDRALRDGYDIDGIIESLRRLSRLPVRILFSGSGSVRSNATQLLADKVAYLEEMGERVRALHAQGWSQRRIARRLLGRPQRISYITLGHFSGKHLVRSYLAEPSPTSGTP